MIGFKDGLIVTVYAKSKKYLLASINEWPSAFFGRTSCAQYLIQSTCTCHVAYTQF